MNDAPRFSLGDDAGIARKLTFSDFEEYLPAARFVPADETQAATTNTNMMAKFARQRNAYAREPIDTLQKGLDFGSSVLMPIPLVGDAVGLGADINRYANEPESRSLSNYLFTLAGIVPGIPPLSATVWRGGKAPANTGFFSRDKEYAKGFDKGDFRSYTVMADSSLNFKKQYSAEQLQPIVDALRSEGDNVTADAIAIALKEDGGAIGSHVYTWIEKLSGVSPERVLSRAGFDAIDTGRDLRVLNPSVVTPAQ